ncbi:MAG: DUF4215 domain-containing protein [Candidatus Dadabacteria bacterium]|nr:MAG: DUF4215 domain-containing protein [Candidatus Dadabacteria bacterium]
MSFAGRQANAVLDVCLAWFVLASSAHAAVLTVPGSYATIQAALDAAGPGDTVEVADGTYFEKLVFTNGGDASGGPVVLRAAAGAHPVLDGTGVPGANMILIDSKSHVRVEGFEIRNNTGVKDGSAIRVIGSGTDIEIRDNDIHHMLGRNAMGITVYGTDVAPIDGIVITGNTIHDCQPARSEALTLNGNVTNFEISGNVVRDVNNIGIDMIGGETDIQPDRALVARNGLVRDNTVLRARSSYGGGFAAGIYVDGGRDIVIENNFVSECDLGIEVGAENSGIVATGIVVRNNVVTANDKAGIAFGGYAASVGRADGNVFRGNTLVDNLRAGSQGGGEAEIWIQYASGNSFVGNLVVAGPEGRFLSSYRGSHGNTFDYNLYFFPGDPASAAFVLNDVAYAGLAAWQAGSGQDGASVFADPEFAGAGDVHLTAASPAIDAGPPDWVPDPGERDLDGGVRLSGGAVDIGADEVSCGNGVVEPGEECDDGNAVSGDGCDANCTTTRCGNAVVTAGEECDDGNTVGGDCCNAGCGFEPAGSVCDDGEACSRGDACDGAGRCTGSLWMDPACLLPSVPGGSKLRLRLPAKARGRTMVWKWSRGPGLGAGGYGNPVAATSYSLCVYARENGVERLITGTGVPSGQGWSTWSGRPGGFRYRDPLGVAGGTVRIDLRPGEAAKQAVKWKAKGPRLETAGLPLASPAELAVELDGPQGGCLAARFVEPFRHNEAGRLTAKSQ